MGNHWKTLGIKFGSLNHVQYQLGENIYLDDFSVATELLELMADPGRF